MLHILVKLSHKAPVYLHFLFAQANNAGMDHLQKGVWARRKAEEEVAARETRRGRRRTMRSRRARNLLDGWLCRSIPEKSQLDREDMTRLRSQNLFLVMLMLHVERDENGAGVWEPLIMALMI